MNQPPALNPLLAKLKRANRKLIVALSCYFILILIALFELLPIRTANDRFVLGFVLLVFALLIVKTIVHSAEDKAE